MNPLFIYFDGANRVNLSGESDAVITGCRYAPGSGALIATPAGETITETMDLVLKGTWATISAKVYALERYLECARLEVIRRDWVYLRYYDQATGYDWRSRILGGRVELGSKGLVDRDGESQHLKLTITRLNYWFKPKCLAPCFDDTIQEPNVNNDAQVLYAHMDSIAHKNYFGLCGHASEGDIPSPVEIVFSAPFAVNPICSITLAEKVLRGTGRADFWPAEGESLAAGAGVTRSVMASAACSAGYYGRFAWSGTGEVQLCAWSPNDVMTGIMRGQMHKGIVRLANTTGYTDLWLCVRVLSTTNGAVLAESLWALAPAGYRYVELAPVAIPPGLAGWDTYKAVKVALYARRATAGSHQLDIDFIEWAPTERMRRLEDLTGGACAGGTGKLVDSGIDGETYWKDIDDLKTTTHVGSGEYPVVLPGYDSIVRVEHRADGDPNWNIDVRLSLAVWYEPRRRNL